MTTIPGRRSDGEGKALFHRLSAFAHAHQWILATTNVSAGTPIPQAGGRLAQVSARLDLAAQYAGASRDVLAAALDELEEYSRAPTRPHP